ncbi:hypothetical protein HK104_011342 [Borealophlyctis nickersoniae]|nr:hypothetical protein HK104_011342 [Borealophlyctis nickersoniae]
MNTLIRDFFGDPHITLQCSRAGECLHYSQVPGYEPPAPPAAYTPQLFTFAVAGALFLVLLVFGTLRWASKRSEDEDQAAADYDDDMGGAEGEGEERRRLLMSHHTPCTIMFRDVTYVIDKTAVRRSAWRGWWKRGGGDARVNGALGLSERDRMVVLEGVQGVVKPGEVMAIMGASGAGKTTFLDILARRSKAGVVSGEILVNGKFISDQEFRSVVGFVDQEDTLMDTLTVYETILYSALLRLPRTMSLQAKRQRVHETMMELGILGIANRRIGKAGKRGISGGEKRRVSIACELVTSPSILFLDEPTSGLDSYNAYNVIESLVSLARNYQRTVIFTIHQPRSNIYALFDKLVLLAKGKMVYSGPAQQAVIDHFANLGFVCPLGFNIADYLVDLTMHVSEGSGRQSVGEESNGGSSTVITFDSPTRPQLARRLSVREQQEESLFTPKAHSNGHAEASEGESSEGPNVMREPSEASLFLDSDNQSVVLQPPRSFKRRDADGSNGTVREQRRGGLNPHLQALVEGYATSTTAAAIGAEIASALQTANDIPPIGEGTPLGANPSIRPRPSRSSLAAATTDFTNIFISAPSHRATWYTQFKILSNRTFKNLYRNPDLLQTHYAISIVVAVLCGVLFWHLDLTLAGFQNRMGVLFFVCAVFGFGCLSSMQVFASERLIFMRERANHYYSPVTYFTSKVLFDLIPLRVIPPILLGLISYPMIGLRADTPFYMLRHILTLVLFNLTAASACLAISVMFANTSLASLVATLVMLFEMLFGGLLLNKVMIPVYARWLNTLSFFNLAWEALLVNEVNGLTLYDERLGLKINVPGAVILQTFGLDALGFWRDVTRLAILCGIFLTIAFVWLQVMVKERR